MNVRVWSPEEEQELIRLYTVEKYEVIEIAEVFNKNHRSIISKLVQLKIYKKPEQAKSSGSSVKSMIQELERILEISIDGVNLSKKSNLEMLVTALKNKLEQHNNLQ